MGHVDGDGLVALGLEAVEKERPFEVDAAARRGFPQLRNARIGHGPGFVQQPKPAITGRPQLVAVHDRERLEHQNGNSVDRFAADRTVFEVVDIIVIGDYVLVDEDQVIESRQHHH